MRHYLLLSLIFISFKTLAQNVGIGTNTPLTPIDLRSTIASHIFRMDGSTGVYMSINENGAYRGYLGSFGGSDEDVDFGTGASNATGKLHLSIRASPKLTISENGNVGINNTNPQSLLDVSGNVNVGGRLGINGNSGAPGQLLVSNGLGAPTWQTLAGAFQNDVRFEATFSSASSIAAAGYTTEFNTNTSAVSIPSSGGITITKTGLYHIEGYYQSVTRFTTEPAYFGHSFSVAIGSRSYVQSLFLPFPKDPSVSPQASYNKLMNFVLEVYIVAPATINLLRTDNRPIAIAPASNSHSGRISGYLIAE